MTCSKGFIEVFEILERNLRRGQKGLLREVSSELLPRIHQKTNRLLKGEKEGKGYRGPKVQQKKERNETYLRKMDQTRKGFGYESHLRGGEKDQ